ncbi:MAG: Spy/CpxP family protein refolding chaperone, partial [Cyanobacteria bacterium P01_D01_bin.50]
MKLKKLSFLASAIALTLTAIPFTAQADINSSEPVIVAQGRKEGKLQRLNLTDEQKTQMQAIKEDARAQMKEILTQDQLEKLETAKANGQKKRGVWRTLNLTEDQKAELKKIRESKRSQIEAIL